MTALFDKEHKILTDQQHGSIISFDHPTENIEKGNREYKKIDSSLK